jgi:hypothetical protein
MWRNQDSHRAETKAVKSALIANGIDVEKVGHGTGTAWAWLHITLHKPLELGCEQHGTSGGYEDRLTCLGCHAYYHDMRDLERKAIHIAQAITGRHGEYDGEINIDSR